MSSQNRNGKVEMGKGTLFTNLTYPSFFLQAFLYDCIIRDHKASENQGGGIACIGSSAPQITQCTIIGKMGVWDCGIYCKDTSSPKVANCTIKGNMRSGIVCTNCGSRKTSSVINLS